MGSNSKTSERWSKFDLLEALKQIKDGKLRVDEAAQIYNISRATLYRHYHRYMGNGARDDLNQFRIIGGGSILAPEEERVLADTILGLRAHGNRVGNTEVRRICFEYCETNGIPNKFHQESRMASEDWYYAFLRRHPEVKMKPDAKLKKPLKRLGQGSSKKEQEPEVELIVEKEVVVESETGQEQQ